LLRKLLPILALVIAPLMVVTGGTAYAQTPAACPAGATISLTAPSASAPTTVTAAVTPADLNIKPASEADATSFHVHYFVDTDASAAGEAIPTGNPSIIHSGSLEQDLGALTPGSHTVTVVVGQVNHTACETRDSVTFEVAAAAQATATPSGTPAATQTPVGAPSTGSGGFLGGGSEPVSASLGALLAGLALVGLGLGVARRRSS
jgi:hypothetical protein